MKTFNATELNKSAAKVFREADINGSVKINHDRYPDKVFVMEARERGAASDWDETEDNISIGDIITMTNGETGICAGKSPSERHAQRVHNLTNAISMKDKGKNNFSKCLHDNRSIGDKHCPDCSLPLY